CVGRRPDARKAATSPHHDAAACGQTDQCSSRGCAPAWARADRAWFTPFSRRTDQQERARGADPWVGARRILFVAEAIEDRLQIAAQRRAPALGEGDRRRLAGGDLALGYLRGRIAMRALLGGEYVQVLAQSPAFIGGAHLAAHVTKLCRAWLSWSADRLALRLFHLVDGELDSRLTHTNLDFTITLGYERRTPLRLGRRPPQRLPFALHRESTVT